MGGPDMAPHTPPTLGSAPGNPGRSSIRRHSLALLRRGRRGLGGRLGGEVVVVGHAPADVGVEVPLYRALGEGLLGLDDLLEHRVVRRLLVGHLYVDI